MTSPFAADRAAIMISAARRVLVTGVGRLAAGTAVKACDLAEVVGAAVDFGGLETAQEAGPTIARIGAVTADPEELRDRADLVVLWFCDPRTEAPGFLERFVVPETAAGRPRRVLAVGREAAAGAAASHLPLADDQAFDLARLLHATWTARPVAVPPPLAAAHDALHAAVDAAGCVAFVTRDRDGTGLGPWSLVGLVRTIAHRKPAFEVPLDAAGAAAAVCTWRYGAAGAIARADRDGAEFRPAEGDAARLVARGEVDCVVAVGPLPEPVEDAITARGGSVNIIRIDGDDAAAQASLAALVAAVRAATTVTGTA